MADHISLSLNAMSAAQCLSLHTVNLRGAEVGKGILQHQQAPWYAVAAL